MAQRPDRPVTIRQKNRHRKSAPELPSGVSPGEPTAADAAATGGSAPADAPSPAAPPKKVRPKKLDLLKTEDLQALADMDRDAFAAAMAGTVPMRQHEAGDRVTGTVVRVDSQIVLIALGGKAEGAMDRSELQDGDGNLTVAIGDRVTAFVVDTHGGELHLSSHIRGEDAGAFLEQAREEGIPIEGKVTEKNSGGYVVLLAGRRAFCPLSQMSLPGRQAEAEQLIGHSLTFLVSELKGDDVVVTRRPLLEAEAAEAAKSLWASLKPGTDLTGRVTSIRDYGVFVDVGGVEGLIHISELAYGHVKDPNDVVKDGQEVHVRVLKVDPAAGRISLSLKARAERDPDPDAPPPAPETRLGTFGDLFAGLKLKD